MVDEKKDQMAAPISRSHFLAILLLAWFTVHVLGSSSAWKHIFVHETCKRLEVGDPKFPYAFCVKTLSSDPRSRTADLEGLGLIALQRVSYSFNYTLSYVKKLRRKNRDIRIAVALRKCAVIYRTASPNMKQLVKEYKQKDYKRAAVLADAVLISPSKCESQFRTQKPLKKLNNNVRKTGVVALSIVRLLAKRQ